MLFHSTATCGLKLAKALDININHVAICKGDNLLKTLQQKGDEASYREKIPALSIFRTGLRVNRELSRSVVTRRGLQLNNKDTLRYINVIAPHSVTILVADKDTQDRVEGNLIWFFEDGALNDITVDIKIKGNSLRLPVKISPTVLKDLTVTTEKTESSKGPLLYRTDFEIEIYTMLLKVDSGVVIKSINIKTFDTNFVEYEDNLSNLISEATIS